MGVVLTGHRQDGLCFSGAKGGRETAPGSLGLKWERNNRGPEQLSKGGVEGKLGQADLN